MSSYNQETVILDNGNILFILEIKCREFSIKNKRGDEKMLRMQKSINKVMLTV